MYNKFLLTTLFVVFGYFSFSDTTPREAFIEAGKSLNSFTSNAVEIYKSN
jgi:hypothetical protein